MKSAALLAGTLVVLWLSLPAFVSSASVVAALRSEDSLHGIWLGERAAERVLVRTLDWLGQASAAGEDLARHRPVPDDPLSVRLASAADALLATPYLQTIRALGRLGVYRVAALAEWFALGLPVLVGAVIDGALMRTVATRSFAHPSPVFFGVGLHGTIVVGTCMVLALLLPVVLHPVLWGTLIALLGMALRTLVANFHRLR